LLKPTPPTPMALTPAPVSGPPSAAYVERALREELDELRTSREGERNHSLNRAAFALGQMVGAGWLAENLAQAELQAAAYSVGLGEPEVSRTVGSGLSSGKQSPRQLPAGHLSIVPTSEPEDKLTPATAPWPDPLAPQALYGLAGEIVRTLEPATEAHQAALLGQFLVFFGNCAGLHPHYRVEADRHGLNEFLALVGQSSKARKGTSESRIRELFREADAEWTANCLSGGLSSGEGLIWQIRDTVTKPGDDGQAEVVEPGIDDKRLLIFESELATVLRRLERDGNSLSPVLRDAWDRRPLRTLTKNSPGRAEQSHISLIGHITKDELTRYLTRTEAANGLGNRFLWMCVHRARMLPLGGEDLDTRYLVRKLREAITFARNLERVRFDTEATRIWIAIYGPLSDGKPGLLGAMIARGEAHVVRLATIYAALDLSGVITSDHLMAALAVWDYCEASARYVFGDTLGDPDADEVLTALRAAGETGLTANELVDYFQRHLPSERLKRALGGLTAKNLIRSQKEPGKGRPATRYFVTGASMPAGISYLELAQKARSCEISEESELRLLEPNFELNAGGQSLSRACEKSSLAEPAHLGARLFSQSQITANEPDLNSDSNPRPLNSLSSLISPSPSSPGDDVEVF
jgi:Protein of unknown function (DUF3987)